MHLNHPETIPPPPPTLGPWKNCLPRNQSLVPKRLGTAALEANPLKSLGSPALHTPHSLWLLQDELKAPTDSTHE